SVVQGPSQPVSWGQSFPVTAAIQNVGPGNSGPFHVQFVLTGAGGTLDHALFLGDVTVNGLNSGYVQNIEEDLQLPGRVPNCLSLDSLGVGRIALVIDPEHTVDELLKTNNVAESAPVVLRVLGTDGQSKVPTLPAVGVQGMTLGRPTPAGSLLPIAHP